MQKNIPTLLKTLKNKQMTIAPSMQFTRNKTISFKHGHNNIKTNTNNNKNQIEKTQKMTVRDAIREALAHELERDQKVFLMGEEVARYDGAYKATKKLSVQFGEDRVIDTPITEAGFTGLGVGSALSGLKPIIEFMTFNFAMQAIDHIVNSAAKTKYMSGGEMNCPIVFRGLNGASGAVGAQHSQCFAAWYASVPGLITLAPYDCEDALGLLHAAVRSPEPVVFLENEIMYNQEFEVPDHVNNPDFYLPIGKAKVQRPGTDVTIIGFARMVHIALQAAEQLQQEGISCEVINLRSIRPLDRETIIESIKKTNHVVSLEEGWPQHGVGAEIAAMIMETSAFDYLDAPMERISGADIPMPYAFNLEEAAKPQIHNIISAVKKTLAGKYI